MFRILSIDGGGIRGLIPALILEELERRAGRPVSDLFDLIAGTSTGGILALGLVRPGEDGRPMFRAEDLVSLYVNDGPKIFSRSVWHRVRALGNLVEEKYPSDGVDEVLEARFGDARLADALTPILVTSYDIELREPHFFKSHRAKLKASRNFLMRDAARATSAAPTYFEPAYVQVDENAEHVALVDGGVFANNPAACALVEGICDFGARPDQVALMSLGTGELTRPILYEDAKGWGLARWAQPMLNVVFDGVSDTVAYQVSSIVPKDRYLRVQVDLHEGNDDMDDAGATNLKVLRLVADRLIREHDEDLDRWVALLTGAGSEASPEPAGVAAPMAGQPS